MLLTRKEDTMSASSVLICLGAAVLCSLAVVHPVQGSDNVIELSIDDCVDRALEVNVSILQANFNVERTDGAGLSALSRLLPQVSYRVSYRRSPYAGVVGDRLVPPGSFSTSLYLSQTIFHGGREIARWRRAEADKRAAVEGLRGVESEIALMARQQFLDVLRASKLLEVQEEALELSRRQLERAEALVEVGSAVISDVLRAKVEVSRNELDLISARNDLRLAETSLCHFLAFDEECEIVLDEDLGLEEREYDLDEVLAMAMEMRPEVQEAEETLRSRKYGVWEDRGYWFPQFDFSADYSWSGQDQLKLAEAWDESELTWRLTMSWDVFTGLDRWGSGKQAKAQLNTAREDLTQTKRDVALEVKEAYYNVEEAKQRMKVSAETVELAEEEFKLAGERYRLGAATMLEQIDSQVSLSEARSSFVEARYDYVISLARLARAVGMQ
jgi:outer membrane protein TolC